MKTRIYNLALVILLLGSFTLSTFNSVSAKRGGSVTVPVTFQSATGAFQGAYEITRFAVQGGQLVAVGNLTGTVTDAAGAAVGNVSQALTLPVANITGTCQILHLELGPLDLNLLGLRVQLNRVVLDITAQQGGGLLGDLLCAVANLLNNNSPLNAIASLLNQILGALR